MDCGLGRPSPRSCSWLKPRGAVGRDLVLLVQAYAREAEERSRKILEEEKARDAAWRQAVLKVRRTPQTARPCQLAEPCAARSKESCGHQGSCMTGCHGLQGNVGARRARYEAGWHTFVTAIAAGKTGLRYSEVPWPAEDPDDAKAILVYGTTGLAEVRIDQVSWHAYCPLLCPVDFD